MLLKIFIEVYAVAQRLQHDMWGTKIAHHPSKTYLQTYNGCCAIRQHNEFNQKNMGLADEYFKYKQKFFHSYVLEHNLFKWFFNIRSGKVKR